jgi:hypothetical protein
MNCYKVRLALALLGCASAIANAQTESPQMGVKEDRPSTGSLIRKDVAWSTKIPLNRTYAELTTEQKDAFNKNYEPIAPGDAIIKGQEAYLAVGELRLLVTVGPDGKAKDVSAYGKVDNPGMVKFAASVLVLTRYKPAICKGSPCTMQFPFQLKLKVDQD